MRPLISDIRPPLRIRLLGDLQVSTGDGKVVPLPASKKTRALLGYLVATGARHRRERLCDLLWEGPSDPRAELRWSLNRIRRVVNEARATRLQATREFVGFEPVAADVDILAVRVLLRDGPEAASIEALSEASALFRGEFLDGLDLFSCYRYQEWCIAEREALSRLRLVVLSELVERLAVHSPGDALSYARAVVSADPLSEAGHARVVTLLGALGRRKEAIDQYDRARRVLTEEHAAPLSGHLEKARRTLQSDGLVRTGGRTAPPVISRTPAMTPRPPQRVPFVGRLVEREVVTRLVRSTVETSSPQVLVVTGAPGIGKSRLLEDVREQMVASGGKAVSGRAFEAEATRPYGIWVDLLHTMAPEDGGELRKGLAALVHPRDAPADDFRHRTQLFEAVAALIERVARSIPVALTFDDVQWLDEASAALLHYIVRILPGDCRVLIACAARAGEIDDNVSAAAVFRGTHGRYVREIVLGPLLPAETMQLAQTVAPESDFARVAAESEGNPLFAIELARAGSNVLGQDRTLGRVFATQFAKLREPTRDLLMWASALGRSFTLDRFIALVACDMSELVSGLHELERRGVLRPADGRTYDFVHDVVRQAAYAEISQPRRTLIHRRIAGLLAEEMDADQSVAADVARHAALAGEDRLAARACVAAAERCLRLFANAEASGFATRGLRHLERTPPAAERVETYIGLIKVRVLAAAGPAMRALPRLEVDITEAAKQAQALGLHASAATAYYLLSVLHKESGHLSDAETSTLRAAQAGRGSDEVTYARQVANTARCMLELETDISRSRRLIREAYALVRPLGLDLCEMHWAYGLLQRWDGDYGRAIASVDRALGLARAAQDRWREYNCLVWLAILELECGKTSGVIRRCAELVEVAGKLGDSDVPFVATLDALSRFADGEQGAETQLARAMSDLRSVDDKSYQAYALNIAATVYLRLGRMAEARASAAQALALAVTMQRKNEVVIARAIEARVAAAKDRSGALHVIEGLLSGNPAEISMRARLIVAAAARATGIPLPRSFQRFPGMIKNPAGR